MKESLQRKLENLVDRQQELYALLSDPSIIGDQNKFRDLSREAADIGPVVDTFNEYRKALAQQDSTREMLRDSDSGIRAMAAEELAQSEIETSRLELDINKLLLPRAPADERNIFLEIRAGTGGEEAALFAADLLRMYSRYAEQRGWKTELSSANWSDLNGYREAILKIIGNGAYSRLKFESGAHRVQRVPDTESQGRIHTSACTVAVLPEIDEISQIEINPAELRIDTYRASGAGGQHVNKTDSAIRITHIPTNTVVECQDERSQHKNRAKAMAVLQAKLLDEQRRKQTAETAENRRNLVGTGDRSERIRTYNFPQGRVTDHRIHLTVYKLDEVLEGQLDLIIDPLINEYQADQLAALADG